MANRILIIDDDERMGFLLQTALEEAGFHAEAVTAAREGLKRTEESSFDVVVTDLQLPEMSGLDVLDELRRIRPLTKVIMITGFASVETAVEAMKAGAYDYIVKPLKMAEIELVVRRALNLSRLEAENERLRTQLSRQTEPMSPLVGESPVMRKLFDLMRKVAPTECTVLIRGTSGTGKELVARWLHEHSARAAGPFVKVDCLTLPEPLLESELFGHARGAFTGAETRSEGRIALADQGTLFLDEIGDIPVSTQLKLLRLVQDREFEPLGEARTRKIDVRILTATNRNLEHAVEAGEFREDLYYRIKVVTVPVPRLAERGEDILLLSRHFLEESCKRHGKDVPRIMPRAIRLLLSAPWKGNVRELKHAIEQAVLVSEGSEISAEDLFNVATEASTPAPSKGLSSLKPTPFGTDPPLSLEEVERSHIKRVLGHTAGNKAQAARILGIHRNTLRKKVQELGIVIGKA